ncbi:MAG: hypothetical protein Q7W51_01375 [Coriobacteriia bacterium]|nr:hypothetical protein [Coriobacteriia bacterium]
MTRTMIVIALAIVMILVLAAPAFALPGSGGAGRDFGLHHAEHAQLHGGFDAEMNPGVMHRGFSGWPME